MENGKYRLMVVDDEADLCEILKFNLEAEGYDVGVANSAEDALQQGLSGTDLLLLDVMMDGMSGFALARKLKSDADTASIPIIFLTARDTENDTITGFNLGADDYISKPFSIREVVARVKAVIRRTASKPSAGKQGNMLECEGLRIDLDSKEVTVDGTSVPFTKTEYSLLLLMMQQKGHILSREELIERVWPHDVIVLDRTVDVNITRLRHKLGPYANHIVTRLGFGYGFEA